MAQIKELEQTTDTSKTGPERPVPLPLAERRRLVQPIARPGETAALFTDWAMI